MSEREANTQFFSPVPQLQAAAELIMQRFPEGALRPGLSEDGFICFEGDEAAADKANKVFEEVLQTYTTVSLTDAALKGLIKTHFETDNGADKKKNGNASADIPVPAHFSPEQVKLLEGALSFINEKENLTLTFPAGESKMRITGRDPGYSAACQTVREVLKDVAAGKKVGRDDVRKLFSDHYDKAREARPTGKRKERNGKRERIAGHDTEILTEIDGKQLISLALELEQKGSKDCVSAFAKLHAHVAPTHTADGTPALAVSYPRYVNARRGARRDDKARAHIERAISMLADRYASNMYDKIKAYNVEHIIKETEEGNVSQSFASAAAKEPPRPVKPANIVYLPITTLNSKNVDEFARYLTHRSRATALRPFEERSELGFAITVKEGENGKHYFQLSYASDDGTVSMNKLRVAELMLAQLMAKWANNNKISKATVENYLDYMIREVQQKYTKDQLGDQIATIFAGVAAASGVSLAIPEQPVAPSAQTAKKDGLQLVQAVSHAGRVFTPKAQFELAPWEEDEGGLHIRYRSANGEEEKHYPTKNQMTYIAALRDDNVKSILLHGETGAGKTKWAIRIALEQLRQGAIQTFYYERATATVGRRQYNPYRKGGDTTIYSAVLEDAIAYELGQGDVEKGYNVFNTLTKLGMVKRYDQMYRRGDNLEHAILLADEVQDKDPEEVFHLITRPKSSAKVVLAGDIKRQNDLGDMSGFAQEFKIFSDPDIRAEAVRRARAMGVEVDERSVVTITFGIEDIKRSPYTAFIVAAHDAYDDKYGVEERHEYARDHRPHPSDRYSNPPKHGR